MNGLGFRVQGLGLRAGGCEILNKKTTAVPAASLGSLRCWGGRRVEELALHAGNFAQLRFPNIL